METGLLCASPWLLTNTGSREEHTDVGRDISGYNPPNPTRKATARLMSIGKQACCNAGVSVTYVHKSTLKVGWGDLVSGRHLRKHLYCCHQRWMFLFLLILNKSKNFPNTWSIFHLHCSIVRSINVNNKGVGLGMHFAPLSLFCFMALRQSCCQEWHLWF